MRSAPATAISADAVSGALLLQRLATGDHASANRKRLFFPPRARLVIVYDSELATVSGGAEVRLTGVVGRPWSSENVLANVAFLSRSVFCRPSPYATIRVELGDPLGDCHYGATWQGVDGPER